jgi:hypothetical protein
VHVCRIDMLSGNRPRVVALPKNRGSVSGMSATLTINLDSDGLQLAEQEARAPHTTLPEVVAQQLRVMACNWEESKVGRKPVTDSLRGAVKLRPDSMNAQR